MAVFDRVVVVTSLDTIVVYVEQANRLVQHSTIGGAPPFDFTFQGLEDLAFSGGVPRPWPACDIQTPLLFVTDTRNKTVRAIDIGAAKHVNYVGPRSGMRHDPSFITASGDKVAILTSMFCTYPRNENCIFLYTEIVNKHGVPAWRLLKKYIFVHQDILIDSMRFALDSAYVLVSMVYNGRQYVGKLSMRPEYAAQSLSIKIQNCRNCKDIVERADGSLVMACKFGARVIIPLGEDEDVVDAAAPAVISASYIEKPVGKRQVQAIAISTALGLVMRDLENPSANDYSSFYRWKCSIRVLITPDMAAMNAMSLCKISWMSAVLRTALW